MVVVSVMKDWGGGDDGVGAGAGGGGRRTGGLMVLGW